MVEQPSPSSQQEVLSDRGLEVVSGVDEAVTTAVTSTDTDAGEAGLSVLSEGDTLGEVTLNGNSIVGVGVAAQEPVSVGLTEEYTDLVNGSVIAQTQFTHATNDGEQDPDLADVTQVSPTYQSGADRVVLVVTGLPNDPLETSSVKYGLSVN